MMPPNHSRNSSDSSSNETGRSAQSYNTAPQDWSPPLKPVLRRGETAPVDCGRLTSFDPRASVDSYASTIASDLDVDDEAEDDGSDDADSGYADNGVLAATPVEFAELFPSNRRLVISHDDTIDGNMNLRVDTLVKMPRGGLRPFSLFHLRMRDLKTRDFSLRRYCRDSGREVCSSIRKYEKPKTDSRPALQRSVSTLANIFGGGNAKSEATLHRADSGYESIIAPEDTSADEREQKPTKSITLEFANYAHVDVTRRSNNGVKRYGFEYWGVDYTWKKVIKRTGELEEISYLLFKSGSKTPVATIIPDILDDQEQKDEAAKNGWVPPCSMRILDDGIIAGLADCADVVVATGLIALVDDNIKRLAKRGKRVQLVLPAMKTPLQVQFESVLAPRKLLGEVFSRRGSAARTLSSDMRPQTPIKA